MGRKRIGTYYGSGDTLLYCTPNLSRHKEYEEDVETRIKLDVLHNILRIVRAERAQSEARQGKRRHMIFGNGASPRK